MQAAARLRPGMEACFELSIGNADKGLLPLEEIKRRVAQFTSLGLPLVVTQVGGCGVAWCGLVGQCVHAVGWQVLTCSDLAPTPAAPGHAPPAGPPVHPEGRPLPPLHLCGWVRHRVAPGEA